MKNKKLKQKQRKQNKTQLSFPQKLSLEQYFSCPIWFADAPEFVKDLNKEIFFSIAAILQAATETAKIALAPIFFFCSVPSKSIKILSIFFWSLKSTFFKDFDIILGQANTLGKEISNYYELGNVKVIKSDSRQALEAADFAWVGSGTSTLESVLLNVPIVLVYKTSWFSWKLMRRFVKAKYAGMRAFW